MWEQVLDNYCERDGRPDFWAEPLNAVTNGAFIIAGVWLLALLARDLRAGARPRDPLSWALAVLIVVIGIGSFLFHTLAVRWSALADTIPIALFMLTGVYAIARRGVDASWWAALLGVAAFVGLGIGSGALGAALLRPEPGALPSPWTSALRGVFGYGPALLVLLVSGAVLSLAPRYERRREAGRRLFAAGLVFVVSLTFRTIDKPLCDVFTIGDTRLGTHFLWHVLNALTLYLTASALIGLSPRRLMRAAA